MLKVTCCDHSVWVTCYASSVVNNLLYSGFKWIFIENLFWCSFYSEIFHIQLKCFSFLYMGDFKNNASISLINVYRLSKADLLLKLILRYVINVVLASCQVSSL